MLASPLSYGPDVDQNYTTYFFKKKARRMGFGGVQFYYQSYMAQALLVFLLLCVCQWIY